MSWLACRRFRRVMLLLRRVLHPHKSFLLLLAPRHLRQLLRARAGITVENEIIVGRGDRAQGDLLIACVDRWLADPGSGIACLTRASWDRWSWGGLAETMEHRFIE